MNQGVQWDFRGVFDFPTGRDLRESRDQLGQSRIRSLSDLTKGNSKKVQKGPKRTKKDQQGLKRSNKE